MGLNLGFFDDRVNLDISYYNNLSKNQLLPFYNLPIITGFNGVAANFPGQVRNIGWEPSLTLKIVRQRNFELSTNIQLGINRNKLVAFPGLEKSTYSNQYAIGMSLNIKKLLIYNGINPANGEFSYQDINKTGTIGRFGNDDDRVWKDLSLKYDGGFGVDTRYKFISLNLLFHFRNQLGKNPLFSSGAPGRAFNQTVEVMKRWRKPGDITDFPRFTLFPQNSDDFFSYSDGSYVNASFIRMSNISITVDLTKIVAQKIKLKGAKLSISGQNLLLFTPYKYADPEMQSFGAPPVPKSIVGGLSITL